MSATVYAEVVAIDGVIPRVVDASCEENDIERLLPWVYKHHAVAEGNCIRRWPMEEYLFRNFFFDWNSYRTGLYESSVSMSSFLKASETVTLPRKNWKVPSREGSVNLLQWQGRMLQTLIQAVYFELDELEMQTPELEFPVARFKQSYVIGGKRYAARPEGAVIAKLQERSVPVVSCAGWIEGESRSCFLADILSIMLGQLAGNIGSSMQDQEVYIIGIHGPNVYIARTLFTADQIIRVHSKGCSETEVVKLGFTRGFDLTLRDDWREATRAMSRLLRYLLSGGSRIDAIQADRDSILQKCNT
ncbi:hypothetical protein BDV25DRAFT_167785 [Aspergillus avenaceus]|uniref:Uncharacterized protein n=1 Tax=Aspergillus avenaceus TaxID=36643 RepID=A0A5N6U600_ASPAV|nr:hypothetical protein BDV25DRAFT_167785 [Aspergillus avenaceus]